MLSPTTLIVLVSILFVFGYVCIGRPRYSHKMVARGAHSVIRLVLEPEVIFETKYWKVYLAYEQTYLGRCVIYLKRPAEDLAQLTQEEFDDWHFMLRTLETAIHEAFDARLFNWGCLMNNAYQVKPYTPLVHWHMRPRYDYSVDFAGHTFTDPNFGYHYAESSDSRIPSDVRMKIIEEIRRHIPSL